LAIYTLFGSNAKRAYSYLITLVGFIWLVLDLGIHKTYPYLLRKEPEQAGNLFTWAFLLFLVDSGLAGHFGNTVSTAVEQIAGL
jgi:hypothetical protein